MEVTPSCIWIWDLWALRSLFHYPSKVPPFQLQLFTSCFKRHPTELITCKRVCFKVFYLLEKFSFRVYRKYLKRCQLTRFCRWCFFLLLKNSRVISFFLVLEKFTIMFLDIWGIFILCFRELFMKIWIFYPLLKCAGFFFSFTIPIVVFLYVFFKHLLLL